MKLARRTFLQLAAGVATLPVWSRSASALDYPTRPVRIIVGFASGSTADILSRLIGHWLSERLSQPFIIENRPGAGSNVAAETVVQSAPDGYTLLWITSANAINATLYENLKFNFIRDIAPVGSVVRVAQIMVVNPSFPAKSVPDFIAYAKANSGEISMASGGTGSTSHLAGELFMTMTGIRMTHVPYRGDAPALNDLMGGQVQVMFVPTQSSIEFVRAGKLRALAVTTATRQEVLPDIPAVGEFVPGYEASGHTGIGAPRKTPAEIVDLLNSNINAVLSDPTLKAHLTDLGGTILPGSPGDFGELIADATEKWGKIIRAANIKVE